MKRHLLASIAFSIWGVSAFGQGSILFENVDQSTNSGFGITLGPPQGFPTSATNPSGSGVQVSLLWWNGTSYVDLKDFTSTFPGTGGGSTYQRAGYFNAGPVTVPQTGTQTFKVTGSYVNGAGTWTGTTAAFTALVTTPFGTIDTSPSTWNGDLVLSIPEPATIAVGSLGATALLLFRRRK